MDFTKNPHYQAIREYYGECRAERSGVLYIQHIDEGLVILKAIQASMNVCSAYCLHPIVQSDEALATAFEPTSVLRRYPIDVHVIALAMEYRSVANEYLSDRQVQSVSQIRLSPLTEVQHMLIADKIQNRKDFERYHLGKHPRSSELEQYFKNWLRALKISESQYQDFAKLIE